MGISSNITFLILIMLGVLLGVATILYLFDSVRYVCTWLFNRRYANAYKLRHSLYRFCLTCGGLLLWLGFAKQNQLLTNFLALSTPETTVAIQKPKYKKEEIKPLTPKVQLKANRTKMEKVGTLEIPSVNLALPIFNSLTNLELARGACVMEPEMRMGKGNYALAGHYLTSNGALFSPIAKIKKNDLIYVKSDHHEYVYKAYLNKKIPPTDTKVIKPTKKKIITLITCADGGSNRYLVRGHLIKHKRIQPN